MLQPPAEVPALIARLEAHPAERLDWARATLGLPGLAPYVAGRRLFPRAQLIHAGVGGAGLQHSPPALRDEVIAALREADMVGVRDRQTLAHLHAAGIPAHLLPDPAVLTAERFGATIRAHASRGEVAAIGQRFPRGYLAVQLSADFGDDATLAALAADLAAISRARGLGLMLFCAGRAPWHDDPEPLQRLRRRLPDPASAVVAESRHLMDLCALIASAALCCASSLHARIVADAFARPALSLVGGTQQVAKLRAWLDTWYTPQRHHLAAPGNLRALAHSVLNEAPDERKAHAAHLADLAEAAARTAYARLFDPIDPEDNSP